MSLETLTLVLVTPWCLLLTARELHAIGHRREQPASEAWKVKVANDTTTMKRGAVCLTGFLVGVERDGVFQLIGTVDADDDEFSEKIAELSARAEDRAAMLNALL